MEFLCVHFNCLLGQLYNFFFKIDTLHFSQKSLAVYMFSPEFLKKRFTAIQVLISPRSSLPDVNQIEQNWKAFPILRAESDY